MIKYWAKVANEQWQIPVLKDAPPGGDGVFGEGSPYFSSAQVEFSYKNIGFSLPKELKDQRE